MAFQAGRRPITTREFSQTLENNPTTCYHHIKFWGRLDHNDVAFSHAMQGDTTSFDEPEPVLQVWGSSMRFP